MTAPLVDVSEPRTKLRMANCASGTDLAAGDATVAMAGGRLLAAANRRRAK